MFFAFISAYFSKKSFMDEIHVSKSTCMTEMFQRAKVFSFMFVFRFEVSTAFELGEMFEICLTYQVISLVCCINSFMLCGYINIQTFSKKIAIRGLFPSRIIFTCWL